MHCHVVFPSKAFPTLVTDIRFIISVHKLVHFQGPLAFKAFYHVYHKCGLSCRYVQFGAH